MHWNQELSGFPACISPPRTRISSSEDRGGTGEQGNEEQDDRQRDRAGMAEVEGVAKAHALRHEQRRVVAIEIEDAAPRGGVAKRLARSASEHDESVGQHCERGGANEREGGPEQAPAGRRRGLRGATDDGAEVLARERDPDAGRAQGAAGSVPAEADLRRQQENADQGTEKDRQRGEGTGLSE